MNILLTILAWATWNWFEYTMAKNEYDDRDEEFDKRKYWGKKKEDAILSALVAALLLVIGHMGLGLDLIRIIDADHPAKWSDLYYAGSGVITEMLKWAWVKFKKIKGA